MNNCLKCKEQTAGLCQECLANDQRTTNFGELDVWEEDKIINIRKMSKYLGVVELTRKEAEECYEKLGEILGKRDWQKEMEEDKAKFI
jgi:hypothetical protein